MRPLSIFCFFALVFGVFESLTAQAQVRLSEDEAERLVIQAPLPSYPPIARAVHASGLVKVEVLVSEQGLVVSAKAISGHPLLQAAAVAAVKRRQYHPFTVDGKQVPFTTIIAVLFPPGVLTKEQKQELEREQELANSYFEEDKKCRDLAKEEKWKEAESACVVAVAISDQLQSDRALEKMRANEILGHVLLRQKRYQEAIDYYNRALKAVATKLSENDAELGRLWGDLAIAHHLKRDLDNARVFYKKAEQIYQNAYARVVEGEPDEWTKTIGKTYLKSLKTLLQYHLSAAQDAGADSEAEQVRQLMKSVSSKP
jgi:TonB family protein